MRVAETGIWILAGLVFFSAVMGCKRFRSAPPLSIFDGLPYRSFHLSADVKGVLVYLHGASTQPLARDNIIQELENYAKEKNLALVQPSGGIDCEVLGLTSPTPRRCWNLSAPAEELRYVDALVSHLEKTFALKPMHEQILGYSNGGYLLGSALQTDQALPWSKVGILAGGAVGDKHANSANAPDIFIEVGTEDAWQLEPSRALRQALQGLEPLPSYREVTAGHEVSTKRLRDFLDWWDSER